MTEGIKARFTVVATHTAGAYTTKGQVLNGDVQKRIVDGHSAGAGFT